MKFNDITKKEAAAKLGCSRMTLHRWQKRDDWPGDDVEWSIVEEWVSGIKDPFRGGTESTAKPARKKAKQKTTRKAASSKQRKTVSKKVPVAANEAHLINIEYKRSQIEKTMTQTKRYQRAAIERYRKELIDHNKIVIDEFIEIIIELGLDSETIQDIQQRLNTKLEEFNKLSEEKAR